MCLMELAVASSIEVGDCFVLADGAAGPCMSL